MSVVVMAAAMTGGAAWAVLGTPGCAQPVTVTASPEITPVLRELAGDSECVAVRAKASSEVSAELAKGGPAPEVWIPDASVWRDLAVAEGASPRLRDAEAPSIARTPVIMAVRQELATKIAVMGDKPTWNVLTPSDKVRKEHDLNVMLPDPRRSAAGLAVVNVFTAAMQDRPDLMDVMTEVIPDLGRSIMPDQKALLGVLDDEKADPTGPGTKPAVVATEQTLYARNVARPDRLAVGLYPPEGAMSLDYPYIVTVDDSRKRAAALEFRETLTSARGRTAVREAGFRTGDGKAGPRMGDQYGLRAEEPERIPGPPAEVTARALASLRLLLAPTRALLLLDTSWSMAQKVPGTQVTRMSKMAELARDSVAMLPEESEVGVWQFAGELDGDRDHKELLPIGPVEKQLDRIEKVLNSLPGKVGGRRGLYDSILAAFREASASSGGGKVSTLLVFTDGRNDPGAKGITLDELVDTLRKEFDEQKPVNIAVVGYGGDVGADELKRITGATNGKAYLVQDFAAAQRVIADLIARRVCMVKCPA
ncbi:substrate-binding and VWA domain-containing protein [Streptosporangium sp. KLBMP 9127]|nr:substrate-binding and VWA domain-containing protein [Streptosporangium sp. KLBMP 9127]